MSSPAQGAVTGRGLTVHVLGSGSGRPSARRDTTSLLVEAADGWTLIDCPGSIVQRLARYGLDPRDLRRLILTHDHVDHVYGFPHLVHAMAVGPGHDDLEIHAPAQTVETLQRLVDAHQLSGPRYPELHTRPIPAADGVTIVTLDSVAIRCSRASHGRDTVAVRIDTERAAFGHSSDTRPSVAVAELCRGVDLLLHDCAGLHADVARFGEHHSSARQAGEIAASAGAGALGLIHLSRRAERDEAALCEEAASTFDGHVTVARDGDLHRLPAVGTEEHGLR